MAYANTSSDDVSFSMLGVAQCSISMVVVPVSYRTVLIFYVNGDDNIQSVFLFCCMQLLNVAEASSIQHAGAA